MMAIILDPTPTLSRFDAIEWVVRLAESIGPGFNPDLPAVDYDPPLRAGECARFDARMRACFAVLGDEIYDIANIHGELRRPKYAA